MKHKEYTYPVRYYDVDVFFRLRLNMLENFLLNAAGCAANEDNIGLDVFYPQHISWVLTHLSVQMSYLPTEHETIIVETWVERNVHSFSFRNFRIFLQTPEGRRQIGQANSTWVLMNLLERKIVNIFNEERFTQLQTFESIDLQRTQKLPPITQPHSTTNRTIRYSDLDYNGHCNSCKYTEMFLDAYSEWLKDVGEFRLDIIYPKEVKLEEQTTILWERNDQIINYQMNAENGQLACNARITLL